MSRTWRKSADRFAARNLREAAKKHPRPFIDTNFGHKLTTHEFLDPLTDFLAGKRDEKPRDPPRFLSTQIRELDDPRWLAVAALLPLLNGIFRCWDHELRDGWSQAEGRIKLTVGRDLYRRLFREPKVKIVLPWSDPQCGKAGGWLLGQAMALNYFGWDENGCPCLSPDWVVRAEELRLQMILADPAYVPFLKPPPPWYGWSKSYDDGFQETFVRDPETRKAIDDAFLGHFEHSEGVNQLAKVPLKIDLVMVDLVERFAVKLMTEKRADSVTAELAAAKSEKHIRWIEDRESAQHRADQARVTADVTDAKWCGDRAIWNDYSCCFRGRVYALQHLNFGREDHVRSLFRFDNGMKMDAVAMSWLKIHAANCEGSTDKKSKGERIAWVDAHIQDIKDIAADPVGTFDKWKHADKPFAFVAACRELAAAWADPGFVTHLPIGFDGSANGIQHLAMLKEDPVSASRVNLFDAGDGDPSSVYEDVITRAIELIDLDDSPQARKWRECFKLLPQKDRRKLLKRPIMTFAYSVTLQGAAEQIEEVYKGLRLEWRHESAFLYLAKKVLQACKEELAGPQEVMDHLVKVAKHCTAENRFLQWTSPSGFPVENRYRVPNEVRINCMSGSIRIRHTIADGFTEEIDREQVKRSAAPNFVHSLDAAHLIKVVNAAANEGITDILTVHDCFSCLAPHAERFQKIITHELSEMYANNDPLLDLQSRNGGPAPPPKGMLLKSGERLCFTPEHVKGAPNAFG
jgi:DNA-directed RNA polymerase